MDKSDVVDAPHNPTAGKFTSCVAFIILLLVYIIQNIYQVLLRRWHL